MKTSQSIEKKGILALKEEYEKEVNRLQNILDETRDSEFLSSSYCHIEGKVTQLNQTIKDLEELLK